MRQAVFLATLLFATQAWAQGAPTLTSERPRRVDLRWETNPAAARGYEVWRRDAEKELWTRLSTTDSEARTFVDRTVRPRAAYVYRVDGLAEGKIPGIESAPVETLDAFYLEVRSAAAGSARLVVHRWDAGFGEWMRSDPFDVKVGDPIGEAGMITDFRTGATLEHVGADAVNASLLVVRYETRDGRELQVTSRDRPPKAVFKPKVKKKERRIGTSTTRSDAGKGKGTTPEPVAPEPSKFPEPTRVGDLSGTKVRWEIKNSSDVVMNVLVLTPRGGKSSRKLRQGESFVAKFKRGGKVTVSVAPDAKKIRALYGEFNLVPGSAYRSELKIRFVPREGQ
jgi:hypothetical protein